MAEILRDFYAQMLSDLPSQFKGKPRIEGLIYALSRQLNDVRDLFTNLNEHRSLMTAYGKQLDGIGNIAVLTREEATQLALKSSTFTKMTDELYRLYLIHKIMANMTNCTYQEMYDAMRILWGKTPIWYSEDINEPATITLTVPALSSFDDTSTFLGLWEIRPAGVQLHFTATASEAIIINADFSSSAFIITHDKTGTKPRRGTLVAIDGIIIDESLTSRVFAVIHRITSEELHCGTNPHWIMFLDVGHIEVDETLSRDYFVAEHDLAGTKPRKAIDIQIDGIEVHENGTVRTFSVEHLQTSEELHSGTHPKHIMFLDNGVFDIEELINNGYFVETHDRTGTKPYDEVLVELDGVEIDETGIVSLYAVKPSETSEDLHTGTIPQKVVTLNELDANIYEHLSKEVIEIDFDHTGTEPRSSVCGENDSAGIATSMRSATFSVKPRKCGTGKTKS